MSNFSARRESVFAWFLRWKREIVFGLIVLLVSSISFCLGYLANRELNRTPIVIELQNHAAR